MAITIREIFVKLFFEADTKGAEKFDKSIDVVGKGLEDLASKAKQFAVGFGAAIVAGFSVGAVKDFLTEQETLVREMDRNLGQINATADEYQRLAFVAREAGVDIEGMQQAIVDLSEKAAIAETEGGGESERFAKLGINLRDANGVIKTGIPLFLEYADAQAKAADGGEKTADAMALGSTELAKLIPLMNKGSGGIRAMMDSNAASATVMTEETLVATRKYSEATRRLGDAVTLLRSASLDKLLPILTAVTKKLTEILSDTDLVAKAMLRLRQAAILTAAALSTIVVGRLAAALVRLPTLISTVVTGLRTLRATLFSVNAAMIVIPLAIAAILLAGQDLFTWIQGGDSLIGRFIAKWAESDGVLGSVARTIQSLRPTFVRFFDIFVPVINNILPKLLKLVALVGGAFENAIGPAIVKFANELIDVITEFEPLISEIIVQIGQIVAQVILMAGRIISVLSTTVIPLIKTLLPIVITIVNGILNAISAILPAVSLIFRIITPLIQGVGILINGLISGISTILVGLATLITDIVLGIVEFIDPIIKSVSETFTAAIDLMGGALNTLVGWFNEAFDAIAEIIKPVSDSIGAVIDGVSKITGGGPKLLDVIAASAPRAAASSSGGFGGSVSNSNSSISMGGLTVSVGGNTTLGPGDIARETEAGATAALLAAQRRETARGLA